MPGLLLSLFFQPLRPSDTSPGNKTQGRSLKVTLYSYRLSHNNGERRGKFFAKNVFFAILVAQKGGKNYGETSIFRLGLEFGE